METLFKSSDGKGCGMEEIRQALRDVGADDCQSLFIHSDVMFGIPTKGFSRKRYLNLLYEAVEDLGVKIIVPTFTYSFCNHETYDVLKSKTAMGAFNEFVRKQHGRYRTSDPLLSLSVPIEFKSHFEKYDGEHSLGEGGGLDAVHHLDAVKFLFLGADMGGCFTYLHYVEKMLEVPYRFDMEFHGNVVDESGQTGERTQFMHTQCYGVKLPDRYGYFEKELAEAGVVKRKRVGDRYISCLSERDAYREIWRRITGDINYFLARPFKASELIRRYTYDAAKGRITHC